MRPLADYWFRFWKQAVPRLDFHILASACRTLSVLAVFLGSLLRPHYDNMSFDLPHVPGRFAILFLPPPQHHLNTFSNIDYDRKSSLTPHASAMLVLRLLRRKVWITSGRSRRLFQQHYTLCRHLSKLCWLQGHDILSIWTVASLSTPRILAGDRQACCAWAEFHQKHADQYFGQPPDEICIRTTIRNKKLQKYFFSFLKGVAEFALHALGTYQKT